MPNQVDRVHDYASLSRVGVPGRKHLPTELQNNFITTWIRCSGNKTSSTYFYRRGRRTENKVSLTEMWERKRRWLGWVGPQLALSLAPVPRRPVTLHPAFAVDDITDFPNTLQQFPAFQGQAKRGCQWGTWVEMWPGQVTEWKWRPHQGPFARSMSCLFYCWFFSPLSLDRFPCSDGASPDQSWHVHIFSAQDHTVCSRKSTGTKVKGVGRERATAQWESLLQMDSELWHTASYSPQPRCFSLPIGLWGQSTRILSTVSSSHCVPQKGSNWHWTPCKCCRKS